MNFNTNCIHEKIKHIRTSHNLNHGQFGKILNVCAVTVNRYEDKELQPTYEFLNSLIHKFKINPYWLFFNEEPFSLEEQSRINSDYQEYYAQEHISKLKKDISELKELLQIVNSNSSTN
jgi:transcriptional regulator with XRE-family HTH domain